MSSEPGALRLADELDRDARINPKIFVTDARIAAAAELRRLHAEREADRATMREALEPLEEGRDALRAEADQFHCAMRGYKPDEHEAMDEAVRRADAAIEKLKARL